MLPERDFWNGPVHPNLGALFASRRFAPEKVARQELPTKIAQRQQEHRV